MLKNISRVVLSILISFMNVIFMVPAARAAADTCTWTGATSNLWSVGTNWTGCDNGNVPDDGDTLVFPDSAAGKTNSNDIVGLDLNTIAFNGNNYALSGNAINMIPVSSTAIAFNGTNNTFGIASTINGTSSKAISSGGNNIISGTVALNLTAGADMNTGSSSGTTLTYSGGISGTTRGFIISNEDGGTVDYTAISTFTHSGGGTMQINDGALVYCGAIDCLGAGTTTVDMFGGSAMVLGAAPFDNNINLNAGTGVPRIVSVNAAAATTGTITLVNTDASFSAGFGASLQVNGNVDLGANTLTYGGLSTGYQIIQNGIVSGAGNVVANRQVQLSTNNTYLGTTTVNSFAILSVNAAASLGTAAGITNILSSGQVLFTLPADTTITENFSVVGALALQNTGFSPTLTGTLTLNGDTTLSNGSVSPVFINGVIGGTGNLTFTKTGSGSAYTFGGSTVNTYVGSTTVLETALILNKTAGGVGVTGNLNVIATALSDAGVIISNNGGNQVSDTAVINLTSDPANDAVIGSQNANEVIGMLTGNGNFIMSGAGQGITVGNGNLSGSFSGIFTNNVPSVITKVGTGTWNLAGVTYGGVAGQGATINVNGGAVNWGGAALTAINTVVGSGGTLKGTGAIGATTVNSGGTLSTGNSPGCLTIATLTLNSGSNFNQDIASATACSGYDQTTVTGAASLGNATLNVTPTYTPAIGAVFTILKADSITGTFNGLADGATITANGITFKIKYTAKEVTLTYQSGILVPNTGLGKLTNTGDSLWLIDQIALYGIALGLLSVIYMYRRYRTKDF